MEELLLHTLLARQEMNVVNQKQVDAAVLLPEFDKGLVLEPLDIFIREGFRGEVGNPRIGVPKHVMADRLHEMSLPQSRATVDEKRVVGAGGGLRHGKRGGMAEIIGGADHEIIKGEFRIENRVRSRARRGGTPGRWIRAFGLRRLLLRTRRHGTVPNQERDVIIFAGHRGDRLLDQRQIVFLQPRLVKIIPHHQRERIPRDCAWLDDFDPPRKHIRMQQIAKMIACLFPNQLGILF